MLTSHQSRRLPQPGKAPLQACKCKQSRASDKREWKSHTQPAKPVTKPRIKTRRIEKDSHRALPLIPGGQARTILRPQPAPTLSSLVSILPIAPNTIAIAHLTRRSPKHNRSSTARLAGMGMGVTCGPPGGVHGWRPRVLGTSTSQEDMFRARLLAGESLALLHGRLIARCALRVRLIQLQPPGIYIALVLALIGSHGSDALDLVVWCMHRRDMVSPVIHSFL